MLRTQEIGEKTVEWHQDPIYTQHLNPYILPSDMNVLSERIVNVWIPLCDVVENQAPLRLIEASHKNGIFPHTDISASSNKYHVPIFGLRDPWLTKFGLAQRSIPISSGNVIYFNHTIIHGSSPNMGKQNRWSLDLRFIDSSVNTFRPSSGFSTNLTVEDWIRVNSVPSLSQTPLISNYSKNCYVEDSSDKLEWFQSKYCQSHIFNCIRPKSFPRLDSDMAIRCQSGTPLKTYDYNSLGECLRTYKHKPKILFAGESVTRGLHTDFIRIVKNSLNYYTPKNAGQKKDVFFS
jgi:hypothetical protein